MNIRKLKKLIKTEKLSNHRNRLLVKELNGRAPKSFILKISKKLNLYIEDPNKIEPNSFVVDLGFRNIYFVKNVENGWMSYYRSYTIEGGNWYDENDEIIRKETAYSFCDGEAHGGCCTLTEHYRKALPSEILKLPNEGILTKF